MSPRKVPLPLRIEPELLARVDAARGDVSRTRWVERALEKALSEPEDQPPRLREGSGGLPVDSGGRTRPAPPRAPEEPVAEVLGAKVFKGASVPKFRCPIARCEFRAKSPAAKCGAHGRTVVPV